jgi:ribonucleoside-diphosphate reductase alpha chain
MPTKAQLEQQLVEAREELAAASVMVREAREPLEEARGRIDALEVAVLAATKTAVRRTLPDVRPSKTHKFKIFSPAGDHTCYVTVGFYEDGQLGEVFLSIGKQGSTLNGLLNVIGVLISYALQYGVPPGDLVGKLTGSNFEPQGPTSNPALPNASSIVDYVFRWLDDQYGPFRRPPQTSPLVDSEPPSE